MSEMQKYPVTRHCPPSMFFSVSAYTAFEAPKLIPLCQAIFEELITPHRYIRDRHVSVAWWLIAASRGHGFPRDKVDWLKLERITNLRFFDLELREEERKFNFERPDIAKISADCEPKVASCLECHLDRNVLFGEHIPRVAQDTLVNIAKEAFAQLNGVTGYITVDCVGAREGGNESPYESTLGLSAPWAAFDKYKGERLFHKHTRGYFWGNFLSQSHVEILGGERILAQAPVIAVERVGTGYYLQLTEDINEIDLIQLRKLKTFLEPVLPIAYYDTYMTPEKLKNLPDFVL